MTVLVLVMLLCIATGPWPVFSVALKPIPTPLTNAKAASRHCCVHAMCRGAYRAQRTIGEKVPRYVKFLQVSRWGWWPTESADGQGWCFFSQPHWLHHSSQHQCSPVEYMLWGLGHAELKTTASLELDLRPKPCTMLP
jgi:hypothetical protein